MQIETPRFRLRPLGPADATDRYLAWLRDPETQRFILTATSSAELEKLRHYIVERRDRSDVLFLGVFTREHGEHIGNIKYEPIHAVQGEAVMGILIGETAWRGRGVAGEVIKASAEWLSVHHGIRVIKLGVDRQNAAAIAAYEKTGFLVETRADHQLDPAGKYLTMTMRLEGRPA